MKCTNWINFMEKIVIFGASSQSDSVLDCVLKEGKFKVVGFIDSYKKKGDFHNGIEVLGSEYELRTICIQYEIFGGIVDIQNNYMRKCIVDKVLSILPQFNFVSTVDPTAIVETNVVIGHGVAVLAGAVIKSMTQIDDFCIVGSNSVVEHKGNMQSFSSLAKGVYCGTCFCLGKYSALYSGTSIVANVRIGSHVVAFAQSFVTEDVQDNVLAHFIPSNDPPKKEPSPLPKKILRRSSSFMF